MKKLHILSFFSISRFLLVHRPFILPSKKRPSSFLLSKHHFSLPKNLFPQLLEIALAEEGHFCPCCVPALFLRTPFLLVSMNVYKWPGPWTNSGQFQKVIPSGRPFWDYIRTQHLFNHTFFCSYTGIDPTNLVS
jgi:hypothetical protein